MSLTSEFTKGIWKENPIFRLVLGMCPTLAVTTSLENALGMGMAATFVLVCSNKLYRPMMFDKSWHFMLLRKHLTRVLST